MKNGVDCVKQVTYVRETCCARKTECRISPQAFIADFTIRKSLSAFCVTKASI